VQDKDRPTDAALAKQLGFITDQISTAATQSRGSDFSHSDFTASDFEMAALLTRTSITHSLQAQYFVVHSFPEPT
jgi:hypothetical protein